MFFTKEKISTKENKLYTRILIVNLIGLIIEIFPATLTIRGIIPVSHSIQVYILKLILI